VLTNFSINPLFISSPQIAADFLAHADLGMLEGNLKCLKMIGHAIESDEFLNDVDTLRTLLGNGQTDKPYVDLVRHRLVALIEGHSHHFAAKTKHLRQAFHTPPGILKLNDQEFILKHGYAYLHGVGIPLVGKTSAHRRKLMHIVRLLKVPDEELRIPELVFPEYRFEVTQRIRNKKPIRLLVAYDEHSNIAVIYDFRFGTAFYVPITTGWVMQGAKAIVPMIHGAGGANSTGLSMVAPALHLRKMGYSAMSFDCPNHGYAHQSAKFNLLPEYILWLDYILNYFRYLANGLPVVAIGRSHGDNALEEHATLFPRKLKAIIGVSGYDPLWSIPNLHNLNERIRAGKFRPNKQGLIMALLHEGLRINFSDDGTVNITDVHKSQWLHLDEREEHLRNANAGGTPTLKLTGKADEEYSHGVPDFWKQREDRAKRLGHQHLVVENGPHDLLSLKSSRLELQKDQIVLIYQTIDEFLKRVILS